LNRVELNVVNAVESLSPDQMLVVEDALVQLEIQASAAAEIFKLRYFANCSIEEAAELAGISRATAYRHWTFARAWLASRFEPEE